MTDKGINFDDIQWQSGQADFKTFKSSGYLTKRTGWKNEVDVERDDFDMDWKYGTDNDYFVRSCAWSPPGCHPVGCGVILHVKEGKLVGVEGDPENPITQGRLCVRCLNLPDYVNHEKRILHPMKRAREDRGKDKWEQITWDEAYDIIERETNRIKETYGPETIVLFSGTGREAVQYSYPLCFAVLGSPNSCFALSGYSCMGPRAAITDFIVGCGYPEIDIAGYFPNRYDDERFTLPEYVIIWGKNPIYSNPDGFFGHAIIDMMKRGTKIITVDPRITWLASRAEYAITLRPGTDAAVALGMMNVIISEDLYDHDFVENWCYGFNELKERVQEYPPSKVAEICWIEEEVLVGAARAFAKAGNSSIQWGLALDENSNGVQAAHGILNILALTGNLDVPGGIALGRAMLVGKWRTETRKALPEGVWERRIGYKEYPGYSAAQAHPQPDIMLEALETGEPYQLRMAWYQSSNLLAPSCSAQPKRWHKALQKMEFAVGTDIFMNPTIMALADIFLPLASYAEHDGMVLTHFGRNISYAVSAMNKALDVGDVRSDLEICFELGKRMNPDFWPFDTVEDFFSDMLEPGYGITFDELRNGSVFQPNFEYYKYEKGMLREDGKPGFETVTGLVELKSTLFELFGDDALPYYQEPVLSPLNPELADYPLVLTTGYRNVASFHSEHRGIESLRAITPDPLVEIHPDTAAKYGIKEGDWVCMENPYGKAVEKAHLTQIVHPNVVNAAHGWWYPEQDGEEPNLYGVWKSNINSLVPHHAVGKIGFGAPFKCIVCKIYPVDSLEYAPEHDETCYYETTVGRQTAYPFKAEEQ